MLQKEVEIRNRFGLHARPASLFVKVVTKHRSKVLVNKEDMVVKGDSIMDLLILEADCGSKITIRVDGPDEKETLEELIELIDSWVSEDYLKEKKKKNCS